LETKAQDEDILGLMPELAVVDIRPLYAIGEGWNDAEVQRTQMEKMGK
jgi:hypothetical protein